MAVTILIRLRQRIGLLNVTHIYCLCTSALLYHCIILNLHLFHNQVYIYLPFVVLIHVCVCVCVLHPYVCLPLNSAIVNAFALKRVGIICAQFGPYKNYVTIIFSFCNFISLSRSTLFLPRFSVELCYFYFGVLRLFKPIIYVLHRFLLLSHFDLLLTQKNEIGFEGAYHC